MIFCSVHAARFFYSVYHCLLLKYPVLETSHTLWPSARSFETFTFRTQISKLYSTDWRAVGGDIPYVPYEPFVAVYNLTVERIDQDYKGGYRWASQIKDEGFVEDLCTKHWCTRKHFTVKTYRARILKHSMEAEKSTFQGELSF